MYINIKNKSEYSEEFLDFLKKRMIRIGLSYLSKNDSKLIKMSDYLRNNIFTGIRKPKADQIIISGLSNIKFREFKDNIIISIDETVNVPQNDQYKLIDICNLINSGNIEVNPFPIFTYVFDYVKNNLKDIYNDYWYGMPL